jgi:superfamily I DNA and RNA helicase
MNTLTYVDKMIWWVIPENKHYGVLEEDQEVTSIHEFEQFDNEEDWVERLLELEIDIEEDGGNNLLE